MTKWVLSLAVLAAVFAGSGLAYAQDAVVHHYTTGSCYSHCNTSSWCSGSSHCDFAYPGHGYSSCCASHSGYTHRHAYSCYSRCYSGCGYGHGYTGFGVAVYPFGVYVGPWGGYSHCGW